MRVPRNDRLASLRQLRVGCARRVAASELAHVGNDIRASGAAMVSGRHAGLVPASTDPRTQPAWDSRKSGCRHRAGMTVELERWQTEADCQIFPERVFAFDHVQLVLTRPLLDALLTGDRGFDGVGRVVPHESLDAVATGEAVEGAVAMLHQAGDEIGRHTDVKRAVVMARQDIDARLSLPHAIEIADGWMAGQARRDGGACG